MNIIDFAEEAVNGYSEENTDENIDNNQDSDITIEIPTEAVKTNL